MAENVVLENKYAADQTFDGTNEVELTTADGEKVRYGSVKSVAGVAYDSETGDVPLTAAHLEAYTKKETDEKITAAKPDLSGYYTKKQVDSTLSSNYYTKKQTEAKIAEGVASGVQSDFASLDICGPDFIKNRTHYDTRTTLTWEIGTVGSETVTQSGTTFERISDKPIAGSSFDGFGDLPTLLKTLRVTLETGGNTYPLELNAAASVIVGYLLNQEGTQGGFYSFMYCQPYVDSETPQDLLDDALDFWVYVMTVRAGSVLTTDEDTGQNTALNGGTYVSFSAQNSGITSGTITIEAGALQQLDKKFLPEEAVVQDDLKGYATMAAVEAKIKAAQPNLSGYVKATELSTDYYTKKQVAEMLAAILPAFSAADEGKVLGIQSGKLAWVTVATGTAEETTATAEIDGNTLVVDGEVDGSTLVVNAEIDGTTLVVGSGDGDTAAEVSGTALLLDGDIDGTALVLDCDIEDGALVTA